MTHPSIIIIGGGLAGLATGCYAQMNGYRTTIFEQHTVPGGACASWKRQGFTIDGCLYWLMGSKPGTYYYQIYQELGALDGNRLLTLEHYCRYIDEASGQMLDVSADLDRMADELKTIAPNDCAAIDEWINAIRAFKGLNLLDPRNPRALLEQVWQMRRSPERGALFQSAAMIMQPIMTFASKIRSRFLRWALARMYMPGAPMVFLLSMLGQLANGELAVVEGGSTRLALAIARRYRQLGGELVCGALVDKILVQDDAAVGVRLADGSEYRADLVVSAADGYSTIFHMLEGRYADAAIRRRYQSWPLFPSVLFVNFGLGRCFPEAANSNHVALTAPLTMGEHTIAEMNFHFFQYDPTLAPPGKTVVQSKLTADFFDYWNQLRQRGAEYEAEKARIASEVLARIERHVPGLSASVEMTDVATPYTFWRFTRNYKSSSQGWLLTPESLQVELDKTLPGLRNFYMAGQWVELGGGIPGVLRSGRNLVEQRLCPSHGKTFRAFVE